jgi:histidinol-phosphate/aromatic aminotransferase/cobyric acid decarboxylase-like protein
MTHKIKLYSHSQATATAHALKTAGFSEAMETAAQAALQPTAAQAIAAKVDRLGVLHAALADMKREADTLRAELEDAGLDSIEGHLYRVNFAQCAGRTLTDWKTIAERLKPSPQLVRAHTTTGEPSTRMTVKARQTH